MRKAVSLNELTEGVFRTQHLGSLPYGVRYCSWRVYRGVLVDSTKGNIGHACQLKDNIGVLTTRIGYLKGLAVLLRYL